MSLWVCVDKVFNLSLPVLALHYQKKKKKMGKEARHLNQNFR